MAPVIAPPVHPIVLEVTALGQDAVETGVEVTTCATPPTAAGAVRVVSVVKRGCFKEAVKSAALPNLLAVETVTAREEV